MSQALSFFSVLCLSCGLLIALAGRFNNELQTAADWVCDRIGLPDGVWRAYVAITIALVPAVAAGIILAMALMRTA